MDDIDTLLNAILPHVAFDGWSRTALEQGARDCGMKFADIGTHFPRGPVDAALACHQRGDAAMAERMQDTDLSDMRYRDRVAAGVRFRLEAADREIVRRSMALFALPQHAPDGARAIWNTCDQIWTALGDTSDDVNWYTKRLSLSTVYSATVLYWLGDDSIGYQATWDFLDRRIADVMRVESAKGMVRDSSLWQAFMQGPGRVFDQIRAPGTARPGYPGSWSGKPK